MVNFDGLILQQKVKIQYSSSSEDTGSNNIKNYLYNMFDNDATTIFCSEDIPYSYFQIDFIDSFVSLQTYIIRVHNININLLYPYPKSWNVTGFDGNKWIFLSSVDDAGMSNDIRTKSFDILSSKRKYSLSSIRLTMIKNDWSTHSLCIADFDINGFVSSEIPMNKNMNFQFLIVIKTIQSIFFLL